MRRISFLPLFSVAIAVSDLHAQVARGQFDFVYAAGLFDYLSAPVASALTGRMFEMTRPGGLMLIPNFLVRVRI